MPKGPFIARCGHFTTRTRAESRQSKCLSCEYGLTRDSREPLEEPEELTLEQRVERLEREVETLRAIIPRG